ncbi:MAG TPA: hypothetical protein VGJ69_00675 [Pyrinomonadaceae bacterium]|jgi:hypothetical protein
MLRSSPTVAESNNNKVIGFIASTVETLRDDMASMRSEMVTRGAFDVAITAVRGDIEQVQLRLDSMEHSIASRFEQVEGELSRLRSAVYLLGKDRPDVLRMLGQTSS